MSVESDRPPIAPRRPHRITQHGETRVDDYYWLRNRDDPEVLGYLRAENAYTEQMMASTQPLQEALYAELRGRVDENDVSALSRIGGYDYYTRALPGQQYPVHCRRRASPDASEEVLLDENRLAKGEPYFRLGTFQISPDQRFLAYSTDTSGSEAHTLYVRDLATGRLLDEAIPNTSYGVEWAADSRTLFYSVLDGARRPYKVLRHFTGTDSAQDIPVYVEQDADFSVTVGKTSSKDYLLVHVWGPDTSEVRYAPAAHPEAPFRTVEPRRREVEYTVTHHGDHFLILTNDEAPHFRLMEAPVADPARQNWCERVPNRETVTLDGIEVFRDFLVRFEREGGLRRIRISRTDGTDECDVHFPEPSYALFPASNPDFNARSLRFNYSSLVTPASVIDYDMARQQWQVAKQEHIPSGYDPSRYETEGLFASAPDGTRVPITLVHRKDILYDGTHPCLLTGYGAYGYGADPWFDASRLSLLERGFVYAVAHVRGGGDLGRLWYEQGKALNKRNTFTDFIACAEHLLSIGITSRERLAIYGISAGGLLIGAVVNMRPDLFHVAIADVPFVDVVTTMSDPTIPLTLAERSEWGNPEDPAAYTCLKSYSPYDNVMPHSYPHILVTGGLDDARVAYWEPAKWVARLRATKTGDQMLLLRMNMAGGHGGPSGRYSRLRETAFKYAFLLASMGLANKE